MPWLGINTSENLGGVTALFDDDAGRAAAPAAQQGEGGKGESRIVWRRCYVRPTLTEIRYREAFTCRFHISRKRVWSVDTSTADIHSKMHGRAFIYHASVNNATKTKMREGWTYPIHSIIWTSCT